VPPSTSDLWRAVASALIAASALSACSSGPSLDLTLGPTDIGCIVTFGDEAARTVGPILRTRDVTVDIARDTSVVIANSRTALHITVHRGQAERSVTVDHADIPSSGYTLTDSWIDADHPGYEIVCAHG
jgi:hypothetical protein